MSHPEAPGDASPEAVAADLGQLASTGSSAIFDLVDGAGPGSPGEAHRLDRATLAVGFVSSDAWALASGRGAPRRTRRGQRADVNSLAFEDVHRVPPSPGHGLTFGGTGGL